VLGGAPVDETAAELPEQIADLRRASRGEAAEGGACFVEAALGAEGLDEDQVGLGPEAELHHPGERADDGGVAAADQVGEGHPDAEGVAMEEEGIGVEALVEDVLGLVQGARPEEN
jgi:hypothetical protein